MAKVAKRTMVCVTVQKNCERLIRRGAEEAGDAALSVVHVVRNGGAVLGGNSDSEALEYLYQIARAYGAEMDMLRSDDVIGTLVAFARSHRIECLVIGTPDATRGSQDISRLLQAKLPEVSVVVVQ